MRRAIAAISIALLSGCGGDESAGDGSGGNAAGGSAGNSGTGGGSGGGANASNGGTSSGGTSSGGTSSGGTSSGGTSSGGMGGAGAAGTADFGPWNVDPSFGREGFATVGFGGGNDWVAAVNRQEDGKVLLAGTDNPGVDMAGQVSGNVLVARLNADGSLDATFGESGITLVPVGYRAQADTLEVQADGKVIVIGQSHAALFNGLGLIQPLVLRLLPDGGLDPSFGEQGIVVLAGLASFSASALQTDGRILAVGQSSGQMFIVRLTADGLLDPTFGMEGVVLEPGTLEEGSLQPRDIATTSNGEVVVVGQTTQELGDVFVARYLADGTPDLAFGGDGRVVTPVSVANNAGNALVTRSDGTMVVAGFAADESQPCGTFGCPFAGVVLRYQADGALDQSFGGGDGWVLIGSDLTELAEVNDGRLIAAGGGKVIALLAYGTRDDGFGTAGVSPYLYPYILGGAAFAPDGATVLVGRNENRVTDRADLVATRVDAQGLADPDYGAMGQARFSSGVASDMALKAVESATGALTILGTTTRLSGTKFVVGRHAQNGSVDPVFGEQGFTELEAMVHGAELLHAADGKVVVVGTSVPVGTWFFGAHRLNADGSHDDSFGELGVVREAAIDAPGGSHARAAALQTDGKLVIAGFAVLNNNSDLALLRLDSQGVPDPSFGMQGRVLVDGGVAGERLTDMALTSTGQIVAVGGGNQGASVLLGRWNSDGSLDDNFGEGGLVTTALDVCGAVFLDTLALQADGKVLVAGYCRSASGLIVARFTTDGSLDPEFGDAGAFFHADPEVVPYGNWVRGPELLVTGDGDILVAGTRKLSFEESPVLLQLTADGVLSGVRTARGRGSWTGFGAALLGDGAALTVGRGFSEAGGTDYGLVRFTR